jgi:hypothetical protein
LSELPTDIFISYAREDREFASLLAASGGESRCSGAWRTRFAPASDAIETLRPAWYAPLQPVSGGEPEQAVLATTAATVVGGIEQTAR